MDRPTPVQQHQSDRPGPTSAPIPMEEGGIDSETDQDPSVTEVQAINWIRYVGVKSVQYVKMGHAPRNAAKEKNDLNLELAVREIQKNFSTDLQLLMNEITNDPNLLKTLVCCERQQHEMIPEAYQLLKENNRAGSVSSSWKTELLYQKISEPQ